ncbi:MAG: CaiB/BaiF CoA transferase family protein [Xanthobacteraceae bacterium]
MSETLPLRGLTVIELGQNVAAPYAGEILGDLGADVIKIEKAEGDDARRWGPPFWGDTSAMFLSFNRHKRSVVVDLRDAAARDALKALILERADVVIQNLRPGAVAELGLDADTLRGIKPSLIYCTIGAFGRAGPRKDLPGYDPLMQAFSGLMSVTGEPEGPPVRLGTSLIDMGAGMWTVIGVTSALLQRAATGKGATIDTSLYETGLAWMVYHAASFQASGELPKPQGSGAAMLAPYRGFATSDGFIMICVGNNKLFGFLAGALGHPEWVDDPRFRTNPDRVKNKHALYQRMEEVFRTRGNAEWSRILDDAGVPNAPMQTIDQVLKDPQTQALGMLQTSPEGDLSLLGMPLSFDGVRPGFRQSPPSLGADTEEILSTVVRRSGKAKPA